MSILGLRRFKDTLSKFPLAITVFTQQNVESVATLHYRIEVDTSFEFDFGDGMSTIKVDRILPCTYSNASVLLVRMVTDDGSSWIPLYQDGWDANYSTIFPKELNIIGYYVAEGLHNGDGNLMTVESLSEWVSANSDAVASPLSEITYNGETIAQLNAGETATLSCKDKKMASDVVVKVNKVESKIPEGYVKPEGSLSITENGTYPVTDKAEVDVNVPIPDGYVKPEGTLEITLNNIEAHPIDCSRYAKVTVNTAEPLRISDPTVLDNITDSPYGVGGSVFLYEGATTDSYENGALYYLEDTEK